MTRQVELYEIRKSFETLRILDDSILPEYNDFVKSNYKSEVARKVLMPYGSFKGELTGSNVLGVVCLQNSGLLKNSRIATWQDLETVTIFNFNANFFKENYIDCGLALRSAGDVYSPNDLLAKNLASQLKAKGIKLGKGKLLNIADLTLREDKNSAYGLALDLKEEAKKFADLSQINWVSAKWQGLAMVRLCEDLKWRSCLEKLSCYYDGGRVAIVEKIKRGKKY